MFLLKRGYGCFRIRDCRSQVFAFGLLVEALPVDLRTFGFWIAVFAGVDCLDLAYNIVPRSAIVR